MTTCSDLLELKEKKGWSVKDWSRATGVNQRVLENIEQGEPLSDEHMEIILQLTKKAKLKKMLNFSSPIVISTGIHKGGAGKTTVTVNMAYELSVLGYNVLVIDTDSQMDATKTLLEPDILNNNLTWNTYECITRRESFQKAIISTIYDRLDVIPADVKLSNIESFMSTMSFKETVFKKCMEEIEKENYYDFVFIDMDKNIGQLNTAILMASDYLLMVSECAMYHLDGIQTMKQQFDLVNEVNSELDILGIILNKVNAKKELAKEVKIIIDKLFPEKCFKNFIRNDAVVEKSQWNKVPISVFKKNTDASRQLRNIMNEILERIEMNRKVI